MPCHSGQLGPLTSWKRAHCKCWRFDASHPASSVTSWEKRNQADTRMARGSTFEFCGRSSPSNGNGGFWTCDVLVHRGDAECFRRRTLSEPAHCRPHSNDENTMAAQIGSSSPNIAVGLLHRNVDSREGPIATKKRHRPSYLCRPRTIFFQRLQTPFRDFQYALLNCSRSVRRDDGCNANRP